MCNSCAVFVYARCRNSVFSFVRGVVWLMRCKINHWFACLALCALSQRKKLACLNRLNATQRSSFYAELLRSVEPDRRECSIDVRTCVRAPVRPRVSSQAHRLRSASTAQCRSSEQAGRPPPSHEQLHPLCTDAQRTHTRIDLFFNRFRLS